MLPPQSIHSHEIPRASEYFIEPVQVHTNRHLSPYEVAMSVDLGQLPHSMVAELVYQSGVQILRSFGANTAGERDLK